MKVDELKVGGLYLCSLSSHKVLVIDHLTDEKTKTIEIKRAGKVWDEDGRKFSLIELHDGQLVEL
jgi:hypothetical protein